MPKKVITPKRGGLGLEAKTFKGKSGRIYLVFKTLEGGFHTFVETQAKDAGCRIVGHNVRETRRDWRSLW